MYFQDEALTNVTKSILNFVPTTEDDGKSITCRAENPKVSGLFQETTWKIEVICKLMFCCQFHFIIDNDLICWDMFRVLRLFLTFPHSQSSILRTNNNCFICLINDFYFVLFIIFICFQSKAVGKLYLPSKKFVSIKISFKVQNIQ